MSRTFAISLVASIVMSISGAILYSANSVYVIVRLYPYECFGSGYSVMPIADEGGTHRIWWRGETQSGIEAIRWIYRTPDNRTCVGTKR